VTDSTALMDHQKTQLLIGFCHVDANRGVIARRTN
jgi:hypothetical protein